MFEGKANRAPYFTPVNGPGLTYLYALAWQTGILQTILWQNKPCVVADKFFRG